MSKELVLELDGRSVSGTNPDKVLFTRLGKTRLDVSNYYLAVAEPVLRAAGDRPMNLKRYPSGAEGDPFFQKRAPTPRPGLDNDCAPGLASTSWWKEQRAACSWTTTRTPATVPSHRRTRFGPDRTRARRPH